MPAGLVERGVEVRLDHAKEPGRPPPAIRSPLAVAPCVLPRGGVQGGMDRVRAGALRKRSTRRIMHEGQIHQRA